MDELPWVPGPYRLLHEFLVRQHMERIVQVDAYAGAFHAGMGLRALMGTFRVRAHGVQCRLLEMQGIPKHLMIEDDECGHDLMIFEEPESGEEIGRVVNLYVPS